MQDRYTIKSRGSHRRRYWNPRRRSCRSAQGPRPSRLLILNCDLMTTLKDYRTPRALLAHLQPFLCCSELVLNDAMAPSRLIIRAAEVEDPRIIFEVQSRTDSSRSSWIPRLGREEKLRFTGFNLDRLAPRIGPRKLHSCISPHQLNLLLKAFNRVNGLCGSTTPKSAL